LCEALGAGNAVIAHDNRFNRWTAGEGQAFFTDENSCEAAIERMLNDLNFVEKARVAARHRHAESFTWPVILGAYEEMLSDLTDRHD
ncbi:glycosyltransferase, partial [Staphylococcus aureus]